MSMTIATAWIMPLSYLDRFVPRLDKYQFKQALEAYKNIVGRVRPEIVPGIYKKYGWDSKMSQEEFDKQRGREIRGRTALRVAYLASKAKTRDLSNDLDCGFNVRVYGGNAYVTPWGEHKFSERFPSRGIHTYEYWNGTDSLPKGVTRGEWDRRGRRWNRIIREDLLLSHRTIKLSENVGAWRLMDALMAPTKAHGMILGYDDEGPDHPTDISALALTRY
jgi:hypothetical protein